MQSHNDEARMSNDERMTKSEAVGQGRADVLEDRKKQTTDAKAKLFMSASCFDNRASTLFRHSSFGFRHFAESLRVTPINFA
jgi:hypothetical protein